MVSGGASSERVLAQYLATKVTWWAAYARVIVVTASSLATYSPETSQCTNQWELSEIEAVEPGITPNQFIVRLEKTRFRSARLRFQCAASHHLLALLARLLRQYRFQPLRFQLGAALTHGGTPQFYYRCIEQFANASYKLFLMQVTVSGVLLLDDCGRRVQTLPFIYLEHVYATRNHPEGMVFSTAFQERLFLCIERDACLQEIAAAAEAIGVKLRSSRGSEAATMSIPALRKRNNEILNQPSLVRFEVKKVVSFTTDGGGTATTAFKKIQLILQGDALVEVHRSMRTVISWPYAALQAIVRPDWDPKRVTFEFARDEALSVSMDARDQLITLLMLGRREAGLPLVPVCSAEFDRSRLFHPHPSDRSGSEGAGCALPAMNMSLETFLLRRLIRTDVRLGLVSATDNKPAIHQAPNRGVNSTTRTRRSTGDAPERTSSLEDDTTRAEGATQATGGWFQRKVGDRKRLLGKGDMGARHSMDSASVSMNDSVSIRVAMEELNANLRFGDLASVHCNHETLLKAIEVVIEHVVALVNAMRRHADVSNAQVVVALQALTRLARLPGAFLSNGMFHRVQDAMQELLAQQDSLTCYWCLKLLQTLFEAEKTSRVAATVAVNAGPANGVASTKIPATMESDQRSKAVQYFVQQKEIHHAIVDLLPSSFGDSAVHSGYWMHEEEGDAPPNSSNSTPDGRDDAADAYEGLTLQTSEARVGANMDIVHFEALLTLNQVILHLARAERQQRTSAGQRLHLQKRQRHRGPFNDEAGDLDGFPAARQSAALAEKLLTKFRFIADSVVDLRLARSAETSVTLAKFLVAHFCGGTIDSRRRNSVVAAEAVRNHDPRVRRDDRHARRGKRRSSIATIDSKTSNQGTHELERYEHAEDREGALRHLKVFLDDYERKKHPVEHRSRLFRAQRTILAPLSTLSQQTTSDNMTEVVMSYRRECERQLRAVCGSSRRNANDAGDDPLTLEHLVEEERSNSRRAANNHRRGRHRRQSMHESSLKESFSDIDRHALCDPRDRSSYDKSSNANAFSSRIDSAFTATPSDMSKRLRRHSVASTPSIVKISDLVPLSTSRPMPMVDNQCEEQSSGELLLPESAVAQQGSAEPTALTASRRAVAHVCDACIGCNDVCADNKCFFCAEKEYQLRLAFGGSAVIRGDQQRVPRSFIDRAPPASTSKEQRQFSSCELRRHQTPRSCWVLVDGDVYDVTDLLGAHPGGAQVLLEAAQKGKDCAAVIANHPPAARQVLANYRLGKFYRCEKRTVA